MQLNISAGRGKSLTLFAKSNNMKQLYVTCMTVLSKHMWKYSSLSIQTSPGNRMRSTFPLHCSDFRTASSELPQSGEAHCKIHQAWRSSRSPFSSSCLRSILATSCASSQSESQDGPLKTVKSTDTASELINNPDLLRKLWIFKLCFGNYGNSSSKSEWNCFMFNFWNNSLNFQHSKGFSKTASVRPTWEISTPGIFSGQLIACSETFTCTHPKHQGQHHSNLWNFVKPPVTLLVKGWSWLYFTNIMVASQTTRTCNSSAPNQTPADPVRQDLHRNIKAGQESLIPKQYDWL